MAVPAESSTRSSAELAASLIRTGFFDTYFVYERANVWTVAWGVRVEIVVNATRVRVRRDSVEESWPAVGGPVRAAREALERLSLREWAVCGWVAFEAVHVLNDRSDLAGDSEVVHLVVPEVEVRIESGRASVVRGGDLRLSALLEHLRTAPALASGRGSVLVDLNAGRGWYHDVVLGALEKIRSTELRKVTLSRSVPVDGPVDFVETYLAGRAANTPERSFLLSIGGLTTTGFCPRTVLEAGSDGKVSTQPRLGTRAPGLENELLSDPEEFYEHAIAVKCAFDDLNEVCEPGSVVVDELMAVKARGSVQNLASRLCGQLAEGKTSWDALELLFPGATISGAPKKAACEFTIRSEATPRGIYSGVVLVASDDGFLDAGLVLRAVYERKGQRWLRAGAGIVASSRPEREFEKTCAKLRSISSHLVADST